MAINSKLLVLMNLLIAVSCGKDDGVAIRSSQTKKIFFTTANYTGDNLGGVAGADSKCNTDVSKPSGTYKALLVAASRRACSSANCSSISQNVDWVFAPNTKYTNDAGTLIGTTNDAGIFSFPLTAPIVSPNGAFYTGLNTDWTSRANNCSNWTFDDGNTVTRGFGNTLSSSAISNNTGSCTGASLSIVCVQQ